MADFSFKVTGLKETQRALYSYSQQLGDKVVYGALMQGARVIARQAKANTPVRTGRLRKAIFVKRSRLAKRDPNTIGVYVSVRRGKKRNDVRGAYYAHFVENGFNTKGIGRLSSFGRRSEFNARSGRKTNRGRTDVPGKKFMLRAYLTQRQNAVRLAVAATERGAEVLKRRLGFRR